MEHVLVTICGRAGSKGFKNKNLKIFDGLPLSWLRPNCLNGRTRS